LFQGVVLWYKVLTEESRARICERLWSPGIDSEETNPSAYVAWQAGTTNRVVVPARHARNRFLGSFKGLQIRALYSADERVQRLAMASFWRTFHHDGIFGPIW
jgi:hypothetical protein